VHESKANSPHGEGVAGSGKRGVVAPVTSPVEACASALENERFAPMKAHADTSS
jgi:hypothetical protein